MKPGRTVEMTGAWKTRKTKPRFPLRFPPPLEIAARFPHSHRPGGWLCSKTLKIKTQERRPCWRIASLPPLGSFFNEKMLTENEPAKRRPVPGALGRFRRASHRVRAGRLADPL